MLPQTRATMAAGASSFGMSGVNAHGLFTAPPLLSQHEPASALWQPVRHWMLPPPHHLLNAAVWGRTDGVCKCADACPPLPCPSRM